MRSRTGLHLDHGRGRSKHAGLVGNQAGGTRRTSNPQLKSWNATRTLLRYPTAITERSRVIRRPA
jgi:hypothetical protein